MPVADLSEAFRKFDEAISLGQVQIDRLDSAADAICGFLAERYSLSDGDVFMQGSYPNRTAVRPLEGGEYDLDLVAICVNRGTTSDSALDDLERTFGSDERYRKRIVRKSPCVRLEYAEDNFGKFHVDVVPVRASGRAAPPLEAPRRGDGWHETAPREYTQWCTDQGPLFARTVKALKRWRDEQQAVRSAIKSIVLQVLIANHMPRVEDDADRLAQTLQRLQQHLGSLARPPVVSNPVLASEDLAARWTREAFGDFVTELNEAVELSGTAMAAPDVVEATDAWRELLGDDFPAPAASDVRVALSDYRHAESPADKGWTEDLDDRYGVTVTARYERKRAGRMRMYSHDGPVLAAGKKLKFKAQIKGPDDVRVWWQVANTGGHARDENGLRGAIFQGHDLDGSPTADPTENWERTKYTGVHLIRVLLVTGSTVVAKSGWFRVNIYARGRPFTP